MKHNTCLTFVVLLSFSVVGIVASSLPANAQEADTQKTILVTGASTGIGRNITETLASQGYLIYAGARKAEDLKELDALENVQAIRLDVTAPEEIEAAVVKITNEGKGLYGLVNNAGVAISGPLSNVSEDDLDFVFDVNVYGIHRVTNAFVPLITASQGRIVNMGSIAGILSPASLGPYSMSKHAVEAYTDTLAAELADTDVKVSVIEPANFKSKISASAQIRAAELSNNDGKPLSDEQLAALSVNDRSQFKEPDDVTAAVTHALFDENPRLRYMVTPNQMEAERTISTAVRELVQLNQDQPFSYDRDALIEMLDAALKTTE
jgi:NAD(P)-dependent dehydrogenase (short-subunit alcohol dehydrogenase family)